ncbi:MAG: glycoside hydrolase family 99-like domain-containing protein [Flavisolibacter sp.]|nr:glycoside hydrolase family 99-like domain-containing protein [Flavisolibacter sp.]
MMKPVTTKVIFSFSLFMLFCLTSYTCKENPGIKNPGDKKDTTILGAYYFNGWYINSDQITDKLKNSFPEREPLWGWITSTQDAMNKQIEMAADAGLSFFSFDWYYPKSGNFRDEPLNEALTYYLHSPNKQHLRFALLVANHEGYLIGKNEWERACAEWIRLFKDTSYVTVDGKPFLTFFSMETLIKHFGSEYAVKQAFAQLKALAVQEGLPGVVIAACVYPDRASLAQAKKCGFDVLTGYNYHWVGFKDDEQKNSINELTTEEKNVWSKFYNSGLPYVPVSTLNWDTRALNFHDSEKPSWYVGFSAASVYRSVAELKKWMSNHQAMTTREQIALIYAWNEYGEGSWLTPSKDGDNNLLAALKRATGK